MTDLFITVYVVVIVILLMLGGLTFGLLRWDRERRRKEELRLVFLWSLREAFGLESVHDGLEGELGGRSVRVRYEAESFPRVTLALGGGVVPPGVRVVEFEDGPYQKYEELHGGRAHVTGDAAFDAKFLVYGERDAVQSVDPRVRGFLLERVVEGLSFTKDELRLYLPLGPDEAAAALEAALALAEGRSTRSGSPPPPRKAFTRISS